MNLLVLGPICSPFPTKHLNEGDNQPQGAIMVTGSLSG